jgi:uncharacterized membrane protein YcaP (DUF421 family)
MGHLFTVIFRTFVFYFLIAALYRIMGKREVGQLGVIDLIVSISIAQLAAISIENFKEPLLYSVIPVLIFFGFEVLFAYLSLKNTKFRTVFEGNPTVIIKHGKINFKQMVKERYNLEDLLTQLRDKEVKSIDDVEYAILETNGHLSVFKYNALKLPSDVPLPLILDGALQKDTLKLIKKSVNWVNEVVNQKNLTVEDIFYAFYKNKKVYIIRRDRLL